jgi:hypothetical protein
LKLKIFNFNFWCRQQQINKKIALNLFIFALCKLFFVHNVFYTNVKFCLQETIISNITNHIILNYSAVLWFYTWFEKRSNKILLDFDMRIGNCRMITNNVLRIIYSDDHLISKFYFFLPFIIYLMINVNLSSVSKKKIIGFSFHFINRPWKFP